MKGVVLANCGTMGLDPERLSLSGYLEALDARDPDSSNKPTPEPTNQIKRLLAAHVGSA